MRAIKENGWEQLRVLRKHYLPAEQDSAEAFAAAQWLESRYWENFQIAVANGAAKAFLGG